MTRNITLRLDEGVLKKARHIAVEQDKSLSQWVAGLIAGSVAAGQRFDEARKRALGRLDSPLRLGGKALSREKAHER